MASFGFLGALGGVGQAGIEGAAALQKQDDANAAFTRQQALEQWRLTTAQQYKIADEARAEQRANAPYDRFSAAAKAAQAEPVPVAAAPVSQITEGTGFKGSLSQIQSDIDTMKPGPDKDAALAQFKKQVDDAKAEEQAKVKDKTRSRTNQEAVDTALERLQVTDPKAYTAGKTVATDKTVTVPDGATVIDRSGKVIFDGGGSKAARQAEADDRRDSRQQAAEDARMDRQMQHEDFLARENQRRIDEAARRGLSKNDPASVQERIGYTNLLNETGRRLTEANKALSEAQTMGAKPDEMAQLRQNVTDLQDERKKYQGMLLGSLGATPAKDADTGTPRTDNAPAPSDAPATPAKPVVTTSKAQYDALPKGSLYVKDGVTYRKN